MRTKKSRLLGLFKIGSITSPADTNLNFEFPQTCSVISLTLRTMGPILFFSDHFHSAVVRVGAGPGREDPAEPPLQQDHRVHTQVSEGSSCPRSQ